MHALAYWLPGPWELLILAVVGLVVLGGLATAIGVILLAGRTGASGDDAAPPAAEDASGPSDADSSA